MGQFASKQSGDVILIVNTFGLFSPVDYQRLYDQDLPVIEDHTHDPSSDWALGSQAMYCFASLRKNLPIPDGAMLWSPVDAGLPSVYDQEKISTAASKKLQGMLLKTDYLHCGKPEKEVYLTLLREGEQAFVNHAPYGMSAVSTERLRTFSSSTWRHTRKRNHLIFQEATAAFEWWEMLTSKHESTVPFSCVGILPDQHLRDSLRSYLIHHSIYPTILWPIDTRFRKYSSPSATAFSNRMLSIHCDGRYNVADMHRVASILTSFSY